MNALFDYFSIEIVRDFIVGAVFLPLLWIFASVVGRIALRQFGHHHSVILRRCILYVGIAAFIVWLLGELGFDPTALLATAGVATVAIGFAAQTSLSNLISGGFLLAEKPFLLGDLVRVNQTLGVVYSIDLLSVKLQTLDNVFVRIPNEVMIKSEVTNITRFPIRRMDFHFSVPHQVHPREVRRVLEQVAAANPNSLDEPEPFYLFNEINQTGQWFRFGIWFQRDKYLETRNSFLEDLWLAFDREGIPFARPPQVIEGSAAQPLVFRQAGEGSGDAAAVERPQGQ